MFTIIFGRSTCPYCIHAVKLAKKIKNKHNDFEYNYIDIEKDGITKADLAKKAGKPISTIPQIFINGQHIGGYTEFESYVKEHLI